MGGPQRQPEGTDRTVLFVGARPPLARLLRLDRAARVLWFRDLDSAWRFLRDCPGARVLVDLPSLLDSRR